MPFSPQFSKLAETAVVADRFSQLYRNMRPNIDTEVSRIGSGDSRSPGRAEAAGRQARYSALGLLRAADQARQERPRTIGAAPKGGKALLRPVARLSAILPAISLRMTSLTSTRAHRVAPRSLVQLGEPYDVRLVQGRLEPVDSFNALAEPIPFSVGQCRDDLADVLMSG
jgi:hypothetical protein